MNLKVVGTQDVIDNCLDMQCKQDVIKFQETCPIPILQGKCKKGRGRSERRSLQCTNAIPEAVVAEAFEVGQTLAQNPSKRTEVSFLVAGKQSLGSGKFLF